MFGRGVYFADMFSKSLGYCYSETGDHEETGYFIFLCEVVLGKMSEKYQADPELKLPDGYLSTKGCGSEAPDFSQSIYLPNGVEVPLGPIVTQEMPKDQTW